MGMTKNNVPGNEGIWLSGVVLKVDDSSLLQGEKSYKKCLFHRVLDSK